MLVHGFLATPPLMTPLRRHLVRAGHDVHHPALSPFAIQDVRQLASELDLSVDRVRWRLGVDRVDLVGVSQGGIIGLWWAHHLDGWSRVRRFVGVGAPFRGTWAAVVGLGPLGWWSPGIWQLVPGSSFLEDLGRPLPDGAAVTTIALDGDPVCPEDRCSLDGARHRVLPGSAGPLTHQWLALSPTVADAVVEALA